MRKVDEVGPFSPGPGTSHLASRLAAGDGGSPPSVRAPILVGAGSYRVHMACLACGVLGGRMLCDPCRASCAPGADRRVGTVTVRPAFVHDGAARILVHRLKYAAFSAAAEPLARAMARLVPEHCAALVPVPRVTARRWKYGVDPAAELARRIGRIAGVPVIDALAAAFWVRRRAGGAGRRRGVPVFALRSTIPAAAVLVDDVVTSGTTLALAGEASGLTQAVTATVGLRP